MIQQATYCEANHRTDGCYSHQGLVHYQILERITLMMLNVNRMQIVTLLSIIISAWMAPGCSSTRLANVWRDPAFGNQPLKHMLVVASRTNPVNRRLWEDVLVNGLAQQGVEAASAYSIFGDSIFSPAQVDASIKEKGFDGVLLVKRLTTQVSTYYIPGAVKQETVQRYNKFTQTYEIVLHEVQQPGYTDTDKVVRNEVSVFTAGGENGRMVWSGTGETIDPSSREAVKNQVAELIIPELAKQGIIPQK